MRVGKLNNPSNLVLIRTSKYAIDWDKDGNSSLERQFRDLIKPYWKNQIVLFQLTIPGSQLKLDFLNVNKKLLVEIDGEQHNKFNKHFHNNSRNNYLASMRRDNNKEIWAEQNGITVLHLNQKDLYSFSPEYILEKFGVDII